MRGDFSAGIAFEGHVILVDKRKVVVLGCRLEFYILGRSIILMNEDLYCAVDKLAVGSLVPV